MKKLLLFFSSLWILGLEAQNGFTTYTTNLSFSGVLMRQKGFVVDNAGNKWFAYNTAVAGNVGLVKYDNVNWTLYNTSTTPALPTNNLTALTKDNNDNIWIGSTTGLIKFDGMNFTTYTTVDGLLSNSVTCLANYGSNIYVLTSAGLSVFNGTSFTNHVFSGGFTNITIESANIIWTGGNNNISKHDISGAIPVTTNYDLTSYNSGMVNKIYIDATGKKWIGTANNMLTLNNTTIENISTKYDLMHNSTFGYYDITVGPNNGVLFQMLDQTVTTDASAIPRIGLIEITPDGKKHEYFMPLSYNFKSCLFAKEGNDLLVSYNIQNNLQSSTSNKNMFYRFDKADYEMPLGSVNANNYKTLDINNVKAAIANRGDMHWDLAGSGNARYQVPKKQDWVSGASTNFASGLWIGGLDANSNLHMGAQTYRQSGVDFWPGPLNTIDASTDSATCKQYDKIWKVSYTEINDFITNFNAGNVQNGSYTIPEDILTWPGNGDISKNHAAQLAPFVDINADGIYNPLEGDYPKIKGDQTLYFIYNDKMGTHQATGAQDMGIEVHAMAYAYGCPDALSGRPELDLTTFYDYKIINRSVQTYNNTYVTLWSDVDLGYYSDDYIGCNVAGNYGFCYNGDANDETGGGVNGHGVYPPAQGFAIMKGPLAEPNDGIDNDNDGVIDEVNEEHGMSKFTYFNNSLPGTPAQTTDPSNASEYFSYMLGFWKDGAPFTCGGAAYGGTTPTNWVFTADVSNGDLSTDPNNTCGDGWKEMAVPGDRRLMMSCGPFTFLPGQVQELEYAFVTSFDSTQVGSNLLAVGKLKSDVQKIKNFYNMVNKPNCFQSINVGVKEVLKSTDFNVYPNPSKSIVNVVANIEGVQTINYELMDVLGKQVIQNEHTGSQFSVNVSDLKPGVYFLRLQVNESIVVKKIVKE